MYVFYNNIVSRIEIFLLLKSPIIACYTFYLRYSLIIEFFLNLFLEIIYSRSLSLILYSRDDLHL